MKAVKQQLKVAATAITTISILAVAVWLFFIVAQIVETKFWPVIRDGSILKIEPEVESNKIQLMLSGTKQRSCTYLSTQLAVYDGEKWVPTGALESVRYTISNRPTGKQVFAMYKFDSGWTKIRIQALHRCHSLWDSMSVVAEVDLQDIKTQR